MQCTTCSAQCLDSDLDDLEGVVKESEASWGRSDRGRLRFRRFIMSTFAEDFQVALTPSVVFDYPTVRMLQDYLIQESQG